MQLCTDEGGSRVKNLIHALAILEQLNPKKQYTLDDVYVYSSIVQLITAFTDIISNADTWANEKTSQLVLEKVASMSCKAAIKGNMKISAQEMEALFDEMMTLDEPYHCPHGRPTIISFSRTDLDKKFKRIVN